MISDNESDDEPCVTICGPYRILYITITSIYRWRYYKVSKVAADRWWVRCSVTEQFRKQVTSMEKLVMVINPISR